MVATQHDVSKMEIVVNNIPCWFSLVIIMVGKSKTQIYSENIDLSTITDNERSAWESH